MGPLCQAQFTESKSAKVPTELVGLDAPAELSSAEAAAAWLPQPQGCRHDFIDFEASHFLAHNHDAGSCSSLHTFLHPSQLDSDLRSFYDMFALAPSRGSGHLVH